MINFHLAALHTENSFVICKPLVNFNVAHFLCRNIRCMSPTSPTIDGNTLRYGNNKHCCVFISKCNKSRTKRRYLLGVQLHLKLRSHLLYQKQSSRLIIKKITCASNFQPVTPLYLPLYYYME